MRPVRDSVHAAAILAHHRVANVCKFAVFENQKVVLLRERHELPPKAAVEVWVNVAVRLEDADLGPNLIGQRQELGLRV